ncbi:MAG: prephenate/arogenate dehydrogenase family protein [Alphaproteobacteria bacterium]|nr:prephenate/arogenate dehydrogenase family protein [Alphaproteobacteria bacterium]
MEKNLPNIAVIGLGLIGSSIAHAAKQNGAAASITGFDHSQDVRNEAKQINLPITLTEDICSAVIDADIVFLAVPVGAMAEVVTNIISHLKPGVIVTDTGSTKQSVIDDIQPLLPDSIFFVPGHPLAGTEFSGPSAGFPSLFRNHYWLLISDDEMKHPVAILAAFCKKLGAMVEVMDAEYHDKILAITSHLPHLIAFTIVGTASDLEHDLKNDVIRFSASGFRDFTRIAASDPTMWRDVFMNNEVAVLEMLQRFNEDLSYVQKAIRRGEGEKLYSLFERTAEIRRSIIDVGQATD